MATRTRGVHWLLAGWVCLSGCAQFPQSSTKLTPLFGFTEPKTQFAELSIPAPKASDNTGAARSFANRNVRAADLASMPRADSAMGGYVADRLPPNANGMAAGYGPGSEYPYDGFAGRNPSPANDPAWAQQSIGNDSSYASSPTGRNPNGSNESGWAQQGTWPEAGNAPPPSEPRGSNRLYHTDWNQAEGGVSQAANQVTDAAEPNKSPADKYDRPSRQLLGSREYSDRMGMPPPPSNGSTGYDRNLRWNPSALGSNLRLGPNETATEKAVYLSQLLERTQTDFHALEARLKTLKQQLEVTEQYRSEETREVEQATLELQRARTQLEAMQEELAALRKRMRQMDKQDMATLQNIVDMLENLLRENPPKKSAPASAR